MLKCLDIKMLYFRVKARHQIHICLPQDPKESEINQESIFFLFSGVPRRGHHRRVDGPDLHAHAAGTHHHQRRLGKKDENPGQKTNKHTKKQTKDAQGLKIHETG